MNEKKTESEFNQELRAKFQHDLALKGNGMVMTQPPTTKSKSLEALIESAHKSQETKLDDSNRIETISVNLVDDSPWQPRARYDEGYIQALGEMLQDRGQDDPIIVRRLASGRFELIAGHRRTRAARLIGWSEIKAQVVALADRDAELATLVSNEGRVDLTDYEKGLAYQRAKERGFAKNQSEIARLFGCTQGRVSQCLSLLELPVEVKDILDKYPGLFGYRYAIVVSELVKEFPLGIDTIIQGIEQLIDNSELTSDHLRSFVEKALLNRTRNPIVKPTVVANSQGQSMFTVKSKNNQIVIDIKDNSIDKSAVSNLMIEALRNLVLSSN